MCSEDLNRGLSEAKKIYPQAYLSRAVSGSERSEREEQVLSYVYFVFASTAFILSANSSGIVSNKKTCSMEPACILCFISSPLPASIGSRSHIGKSGFIFLTSSANFNHVDVQPHSSISEELSIRQSMTSSLVVSESADISDN